MAVFDLYLHSNYIYIGKKGQKGKKEWTKTTNLRYRASLSTKKQTKKQARLAQDVASFHKIGESNVWASFMNNKENK